MSDLKVGDKFELDYPFKMVEFKNSTGDCFWAMGCNKVIKTYSTLESERLYTCDGVGRIIFEVLSVCNMPRKYKTRVIYKFDRIDPDGQLTKSGNCYMVTLSKFKDMIKKPYKQEYEVLHD